MKPTAIVLTGVALAVSSCATNKHSDGGLAQSAMLVGGVGVMVALSPLVPVTTAIAKATRPKRALLFPEVYRLSDGRFAISNYLGWFTDHSEMPPPGKGWRADSAWVIDATASPRDNRGRIVLSEQNLVRWYFRDNDRKSLQSIPKKTSPPQSEFINQELGAASLELCLAQRAPITIYLKQE